MSFSSSFALLCDGPIHLARRGELDELVSELEPCVSGVLLAATELSPFFVEHTRRGPLPRAMRLVASLYPEAGILGALHGALLACSSTALVAIEASQTPPPVASLKMLILDSRPGNALVFRREGQIQPLPGRFRRDCLGPLSRALLRGDRQLGQVLHSLRCSTLAAVIPAK